MGAVFPFFQPPGSSPVCYDFSNIMATTSANSLRSLGYISSGPIDYACSSSSGGFGPDHWLQVEWLCSSSPSLTAHPVRRCGGKTGCLWSLGGKMLNTSAFSLTLSLYSCQDRCPYFHWLCISFLPLAWPEGLHSSMQVSCLPFLNFYTWGLRVLVLYGTCP